MRRERTLGDADMNARIKQLRDLVVTLDRIDRKLDSVDADTYKAAATAAISLTYEEMGLLPMSDFAGPANALQSLAENIHFAVNGCFADLDGTGRAGQALIVGFCEETAKVAAVLWFLRDRRLRTEFDGLLLGAAAGMGFAALETAGYAFDTIFQVFQVANQHGASVGQVYADSLRLMLGELHLRMELAVFGHGVWTAIACAAIWRERGNATFRLTSGVGIAFGIAVVLHAAWDTVASMLWPISLPSCFASAMCPPAASPAAGGSPTGWVVASVRLTRAITPA